MATKKPKVTRAGRGLPRSRPESTATTARYAFATPSAKAGEGVGIHVSMIPQTPEGGKLNFFMDVDTALRLRNALTESLDSIRRPELIR